MNNHLTNPTSSDISQRLDHLVQYVRCYTVPDTERIARRKRSRHPRWVQLQPLERSAGAKRASHSSTLFKPALSAEGQAMKALGAPYEGWCLLFDCETTTNTAERLRFGCYEVHGLDREARIKLYRSKRLTRMALDRLHEAGVFYDPDAVTLEEVALIQRYAAEHGLACLTRQEFVHLFYRWLLRYNALVIGHNLPFDLSRLATAWTAAAGTFRGGFTLKLCDCPHGFSCFDHPPIRIKLLGKYKARIALQKVKPLARSSRGQQQAAHSQGTLFTARRPVEGKFLDTATLGWAPLPAGVCARGPSESGRAGTVSGGGAVAHGECVGLGSISGQRQRDRPRRAACGAACGVGARHGGTIHPGGHAGAVM